MQLLYSLLHSQAANRNIHVIHFHGRHILNFFFNLRLELLGNGKELNTVIQHNLYTDNNTLAVVAAAAHLNGGDALNEGRTIERSASFSCLRWLEKIL